MMARSIVMWSGVTLWLTAMSTVAAATVVFEAVLPNGRGTLKVYDNDLYEVLVHGRGWFRNGTTGMSLNGVWYTTTAAIDNTACSLQADVDFRGNDLRYIDNITEFSPCCQLCAAEEDCTAWTWTGVTNIGTPSNHPVLSNPAHHDIPSNRSNPANPPAWANRCYLKSSAAGAIAYAGHMSGTKTLQRRLVRIGATAVSGQQPELGPYVGWNITYEAGHTGGNRGFPKAIVTPFIVSFLHFPAAETLLFGQWFPQGAIDTNVSFFNNATAAVGPTEFSSSMQPATVFPSFTAHADADAKNFGAVAWTSRFAPLTNNNGISMCNALKMVGGAEGGPLVIFDAVGQNSSNGTGVAVVVWSSFDHFKATQLGMSTVPGSTACEAAFGI